jgi:hypothetical protein
MEKDPAGSGEEKSGLELPDFLDKGTTQSYKETFNAAVLLWVMSRRPTASSLAPRLVRYVKGASLLATIYVGVQYDPALIRHILSLK